MRVFSYIARLLLLATLLQLPLFRMELGVIGVAPVWADDDGGGDDGGGDDDGGSDDDGGGDDGGDDNGDGGDDGDKGDYGGGGDGHDNDDAEYARSARLKGAVLPLSIVMRSANRMVPGRVLSVKLRRRNGRYYYHFRILDRRNHVRNLRLPASGRLKLRNWNNRR